MPDRLARPASRTHRRHHQAGATTEPAARQPTERGIDHGRRSGHRAPSRGRRAASASWPRRAPARPRAAPRDAPCSVPARHPRPRAGGRRQSRKSRWPTCHAPSSDGRARTTGARPRRASRRRGGGYMQREGPQVAASQPRSKSRHARSPGPPHPEARPGAGGRRREVHVERIAIRNRAVIDQPGDVVHQRGVVDQGPGPRKPRSGTPSSSALADRNKLQMTRSRPG